MSNIPETGRTPRVTVRLVAIQILVFSLLLTLGGRLWYLQIRNGDEYTEKAANNHVQQVVHPAVRGSILDARGVPLADNETRLVVSASRTALMKEPDDGEAVLTRLAGVLRMKPKDVKDKVRLCDAETPQPCWNGSPYQPIPITDEASAKQALQIREREEDFPGISAEPTAVRRYAAPAGSNAAQVLGYLSPVTDEQIKKAEHTKSPLLRSDQVGSNGLESEYDSKLRGKAGVTRYEVDNLGRVIGQAGEPAGAARRQRRHQPRLTRPGGRGERAGRGDEGRPQAVRPEHRHEVQGGLRLGRRHGGQDRPGGRDGVRPGVRPQRLGRRHLRQGLQEAHRQGQQLPAAEPGDPGPGGPRLDLQGDPDDRGGQRRVRLRRPLRLLQLVQHRRSGLQELRVREPRRDQPRPRAGGLLRHRLLPARLRAVEEGRRQQAQEAPGDWFYKTAHQFGLGKKTGVDLPNEVSGRVPDRQWKKDFWKANKDAWCKNGKKGGNYTQRLSYENCLEGMKMRAGDSVNYSIGQGDTLVTPIQMATIYAAISNGGTLYDPTVGKAIVSPDGKHIQEIKPKSHGKLPFKGDTHGRIDQALAGVATRGTAAWRFQGWPQDKIPMHAKTGTAEVYGKQTTSWFATYTKDYSVVMTISQGGTGSGASGPAVRKIYNALYGVDGKGKINEKKALLPKPQTDLPKIASDGTIEAQPVGKPFALLGETRRRGGAQQ